MNKIKRGTKEYNRLQETLHENKRLKKTISKLRKQISRLDLDRYHNLKEIIEKHDRENQGESLAKAEAKIRKIWECWKCRVGVLIQIPINKCGTEYYFRKCNNCDYRTKMKRMNDEVVKGPN